MSRPKKKPQYDSDKIIKDLTAAVSESFKETGELKLTADEFGLSAIKIRKLLITAGVYSNDISDEVNALYNQGKSVTEIEQITGLSKSSVNGYLPYNKVVYNQSELSLNADRIKKFRSRRETVRKLLDDKCEGKLWKAVVAFQNYPFHTVFGIPFTYTIKMSKCGDYNRELIINHRKQSKTLTWSSIMLVFNKAVEMYGEIIEKPKMLGDIRGVSYIYPLLFRFGMIVVPDRSADNMRLKRPLDKHDK